MALTKIEFAVQMTCDSCERDVRNSLDNVDGVKNIEIDLKSGSVVVDTTLSADEVFKKLEQSGKKVVLKGYGNLSGVVILDTGKKSVKGVVRFVQQTPNICIIDGTVDGLNPGKHQISVHECGDLSEGCSSVGSYFNPYTNGSRSVYGNIGCVNAESNGRAAFRIDDNVIKLSEIIGRSFVISDEKNNRLACGIIARSAGLFQNPKKICACDGISLWDEKSQPKPSL
ncbi:PREDICTED: copper chaperone for superoxide dismutase-like [Nicrophorus vespilloides]|uniref:superoxide dismutase n=1 Tax=Nicrophorus vespilloides TaxID=110193 RepID=A0ABM1MCP4_NICVS|nr:PREDICTED: copper chaperone for superoxide dismutase-like [Nicrophorus vespilloides]XP_017772344.1 PREDICTED: copper chaperone for superoxide dismutase-like [Nicrophorus vespilloides]